MIQHRQCSHIAIILAAGGSKRLGRAKQLLPWGEKTLIEAITTHILQTHPILCLVITGRYHKEIKNALQNMRVEFFHNPHWEEGLSSTLNTAFSFLNKRKIAYKSVLICTSDQPFLTQEHLEALIKECPKNGTSLTAYNQKEKGVPLCLDAKIFAQVTQLKGDQGFKQLWIKKPITITHIPSPDLLYDIDTEEEYQIAIALQKERNRAKEP